MHRSCESFPLFSSSGVCRSAVVGDEVANLRCGRLIDEVLKFFERKLYLPKPLELREREKKE